MVRVAPPLDDLVQSHRAVLADLRVLLQLTARAERPPLARTGLDEAMTQLRVSLHEHLDHEERSVIPILAMQTNVDLATVAAMTTEHEQIRRSIAALVLGTEEDDAEDGLRHAATVVASLLGAHLRTEELAYLGLLALLMRPEEQGDAT